MTINSSKTAILALAASITALASASAQSILSQHGEVVQAVGDAVVAAPGVTPAPGATIFATNNFDSPYMDQNGTVVYRARFTGGGSNTTDDRGLFMGRASGDVMMVARAGDQAPGLPVGTLLRNSTSSAGFIGSSGMVRISPFNEYLFFNSSIYDPTTPANTPATSDTAMFWGPASALVLLGREGDATGFGWAPGSTWFTNFSAGSNQFNHINSNGVVLFTAQLAGGTVTAADDCVMLTGSPGALTPVSREGDILGTGEIVIPVSGTTMSFVNAINEAGQVLHELRFSTTSGTATTANDRALAVWTAGTDVIIAREGQQAPGLPVGDLFATSTLGWTPDVPANTAFSRSGKTVLLAALDGGTTTPTTNSALYFGGPAPLAASDLVIRKGDLIPSLVGGETFNGCGVSGIVCNDTQFAFVGFLAGTATTANDSAIMIGSNAANLTLLAREGDICSLIPPSGNGPWTYGQFNNGTNNPVLNYDGTVYFEAPLTDTVVTGRRVVLQYTPALGLRLFADRGDTFTGTGADTFTTILGAGALSTLSSNAGSGSSDGGGQSHFNNQGDVVFKANLIGPPTACILRGHVGSFIAKPSSVPATGGVPQNFVIDVGPTYGNMLYAVLATGFGTRPGFPSPLGPQNIPLNFDPLWTMLSINAANSPLWVNTIGFLDANGKGIGASAFVMPVGFSSGLVGATVHHAALVLDGSLTSQFVTEPSALKLY